MKKCPKCDKMLTNVTIDDIDGRVPGVSAWKTISYSCPYCYCVLGVQIDPVALKTDIVNEVIQKLRGY